MQTPLVSVVIPSYNRSHTLDRALRSVWAQGIEDMEVLVVDDCSTDDTVTCVTAWASSEPRLRLIRHSVNKGEAGARNTGVQSAHGKFIAFLDSDDEWMPGKLTQQLEIMLKAQADVGGCFTGQVLIEPDGQEIFLSDWSDRLPITDTNILTEGCGLSMGNTFMVLRSVYEAVGYYDENLPLMVDLDWLCRFLSKYKATKIPQPLARYYKSPMRRGEPMERAIEIFKKKNHEYLSHFDQNTKHRINARFLAYISQSYLIHGPRWRFVRSRALCLFFNPRQPLGNYVHLLAAALHLIPIGNPKH